MEVQNDVHLVCQGKVLLPRVCGQPTSCLANTRPTRAVPSLAHDIEGGASRPSAQNLFFCRIARQSDRDRRLTRRRAILHPSSQLIEHGRRLATITTPAVTQAGNLKVAVEVASEIDLLTHGLVVVERASGRDRGIGLCEGQQTRYSNCVLCVSPNRGRSAFYHPHCGMSTNQ